MSTIPAAARLAWARRAEELERYGMKLIAAASKAKTVKSPANGQQVSPKLAAGLKLLEAADKLWARLSRITPAARGASERPDAASPPVAPPSLTAYRNGAG